MRILLLFLASLSFLWSEITPSEIVTYKSTPQGDLDIHVFTPKDKGKNRSAAVFFFGGGWNGGKPQQFYSQAQTLADLGMVAFCADYRVKSRQNTTPFECVKDGKSAIRWVRQNADKYGIDPEKIVSAGGSAGGHVAACTAVIEGLEEGDSTVSSKPNALMLFNPVLDTTKKGFGANRFSAEQQTALSPCHHVSASTPPTLIMTGTVDTTTPIENAQRFALHMKEAGRPCTLVPYEGEKHGFFNGTVFPEKNKTRPHYLDTLVRMETFLKEHGFLKY